MNGNRPEPLIIVPLALAIGGYPALSPRQSRRPLPESYLDGNLRCPGVYLAEGRESFVFLLAGWVFRMVRRIRTCSEIACPCSRAPGGDPPQAATPPQRTMAVSAMAALVIAAQEADLHRASIQGRHERPDGAPPAQGHQLLPTKMQHEISPTGMPARPEPAQGPPTTGEPPPLQESQRTPGRGEHSPDKAPVARKSAPLKPPMAIGATPKGKAMPARGVPAKTLEEVAGGQAGEAAPQGESESTYASYSSESQSSDAQGQESERPAAKEKPRAPGGERPQARPQQDAPQEPSGGREQRPESPPMDQPRARPAPLERGSPRRGRRIELVQVIRSADKGAGHPKDRRPSPGKSPRRRRSGPPDRRKRIGPRREESGRRDPVPDDADRAPAGIVAAAAVAVAAAVAAIAMGAGRAAPSPVGPAATMRRTPCKRAGGNPDPTARRKRAARGRRAFRIREKRKAGTRTTAIRRALARLAGRVRLGLGIAPMEVAKVRARAKAAEGGAKAQRFGSVSKLDTPSPRRRSSGNTSGAERTERSRGSPPRSRTSKNAEGAVAAATSPAQPTMELEGRAQDRPSSPRRPGPTGLPDGSNELPGMAENGALFPGPGTRVFPGRDKSLVHKSPGFCGLLAPGRGWQGVRGPTADKRGRRYVPCVARKNGSVGSLEAWRSEGGQIHASRKPPDPPWWGARQEAT